MWEVEDNKAIPSSLVLEQDFILRVRRLHRMGTPNIIVNIALNEINSSFGGRGPLEVVQKRVQDFCTARGGSYAEMSNGDVFVLWPDNGTTRTIPDEIMTVVLPSSDPSGNYAAFRFIYHMPADYNALRERLNHYVDTSRAAAATEDKSTPAQMLQTEAARGPLTAWSVNQIEKLLENIDLRRYVRTQPVCERHPDGSWSPLFDECYISFDELRRSYFPKLEMSAPEHLFLELCQALDRRFLTDLSEHYGTIAGQALSLNLSVATVMGAVFSQFVHQVPRTDRKNICFEIHRGDLLQDFQLTLNAMMVIHRDGFKVAIDSVTPDMLGYLNLAMFETDYIKLNVAKDRYRLLDTPEARKALAQIPREKIIFFHCDNEPALKVGLELGITKFQGWLIDKLAGE